MKTRNTLQTLLCRLFGVLEIVLLIAVVLLSFLILALPRISNHSDLELLVGEVGLRPESGALALQTDGARSGSISITNLRGTVLAKNSFDNKGLLALARWHTLPMIIFYAVFAILLLDMLRRLFRNFERGESFTNRSVLLVHKIGLTIIAFTILSTLVMMWLDQAVATYLEQHATIQGLNMTFTTPYQPGITLKLGSGYVDFNLIWVGILVGLLVVSLGEVLRQGLVLKEENELTV